MHDALQMVALVTFLSTCQESKGTLQCVLEGGHMHTSNRTEGMGAGQDIIV